jgi:hypothetical protein
MRMTERGASDYDSGGYHIRTGRFLFILSTVASAVSAYIRFGIYGLPLDSRGLGEALGGTIPLLALPLLIVVPWRAIQRHRHKMTNAPIGFAIVIFIISAALSLKGATVSPDGPTTSLTSSASEYEFRLNGCEYSVTFPSDPRQYKVQKFDALGQQIPLQGADLELDDGKGLVRAECATVGYLDQAQLTDQHLVEASRQIALDLGIERPSIKIERSTCGVAASIMGVKDSGHGRLTVLVVNYHGHRSIFTIYKMALSKDWQSDTMIRFSRTLKCDLS